jgi:hypothetical protein
MVVEEKGEAGIVNTRNAAERVKKKKEGRK